MSTRVSFPRSLKPKICHTTELIAIISPAQRNGDGKKNFLALNNFILRFMHESFPKLVRYIDAVPTILYEYIPENVLESNRIRKGSAIIITFTYEYGDRYDDRDNVD